MQSITPGVHHRFGGAHAIGGERHDSDALRRWFERLARVLPNLHLEINDIWVTGWPWRTMVFVQWDGTATLMDGGPYSQHAVHVITLRWGKIHGSTSSRTHRRSPARLPCKRQPASRRPSRNRS